MTAFVCRGCGCGMDVPSLPPHEEVDQTLCGVCWKSIITVDGRMDERLWQMNERSPEFQVAVDAWLEAGGLNRGKP